MNTVFRRGYQYVPHRSSKSLNNPLQYIPRIQMIFLWKEYVALTLVDHGDWYYSFFNFLRLWGVNQDSTFSYKVNITLVSPQELRNIGDSLRCGIEETVQIINLCIASILFSMVLHTSWNVVITLILDNIGLYVFQCLGNTCLHAFTLFGIARYTTASSLSGEYFFTGRLK